MMVCVVIVRVIGPVRVTVGMREFEGVSQGVGPQRGENPAEQQRRDRQAKKPHLSFM